MPTRSSGRLPHLAIAAVAVVLLASVPGRPVALAAPGVRRLPTASGAATLIWDCQTAANQLWTTWAGGEIRVFGDMCLDAENQGTTNGTAVILWACTTNPTRDGSGHE